MNYWLFFGGRDLRSQHSIPEQKAYVGTVREALIWRDSDPSTD